MVHHSIEKATTNASESLNCVLKRLFEWIQRPVDVIALSLERLLDYFDIEIIRASYNSGLWTLRPELSPLYNIALSVSILKESVPPQIIVENIRSANVKFKVMVL